MALIRKDVIVRLILWLFATPVAIGILGVFGGHPLRSALENFALSVWLYGVIVFFMVVFSPLKGALVIAPTMLAGMVHWLLLRLTWKFVPRGGISIFGAMAMSGLLGSLTLVPLALIAMRFIPAKDMSFAFAVDLISSGVTVWVLAAVGFVFGVLTDAVSEQ